MKFDTWLSEVEKRIDQATQGPWHWNDELQLVTEKGEVIIETDSGAYPPRVQDRPLLEHAVSDILVMSKLLRIAMSALGEEEFQKVLFESEGDNRGGDIRKSEEATV